MQHACVAGRVSALPISVSIVLEHQLTAAPTRNAKTLTVVYLTPTNARVSRKIARPKTVLSAMPTQNHVQKEIVMLML
jgi:hypothetical protein